MRRYKNPVKSWLYNIVLLYIILLTQNSLQLCVSKPDISYSNNIRVKQNEILTIQNEDINNTENVVVEKNGKLVLNRTKIYFNNTGYNEYGINLQENSTLEMYNSRLKGKNNLFYFKCNRSHILFNRSHIRGTHILCYGKSNITIFKSDLWATHCFNTSKAYINKSNLHYLFLRGKSTSEVSDSNVVEILLYDHSYANVINTKLKNIFYFDEGWTTLSNCTYIDLIRFKPKNCNLTIGVLEKEENNPVLKANVTLRHVTNSEKRTSYTNASGFVIFNNLTEGDYHIIIEKEGYSEIEERLSVLEKRENQTFWLLKSKNSYHGNEKVIILSLFLIATVIFFLMYYLCKSFS